MLLLLCRSYKNSDAHFKYSKKRYWKIFNTKVMKILHCFSLLSVEMLQLQLKKILSNIAETATDLTVNFWVAILIIQSHINQVPASCFCSERKKNNDQTCAKNKQKIQVDIDKLPRGENAEMNIQRLNVRIDQVRDQIQIQTYWQVHKDMLLC